QRLFPVGLGQVYKGSHFVTAHKSPDLDSTISSFWGWLDAFAARVSSGLHYWNVPGGPPKSQIEIKLLFLDIFGEDVFHILAKTRTTLSLSSTDIMSQEGLIKKKVFEKTTLMDHDRISNTVVIVDDYGYYIGDWRGVDVEGVRNIIMLFNYCFRWLENKLQQKIISLFSKDKLQKEELIDFVDEIFSTKIKDCSPAREYSENQKEKLSAFLQKLFFIEEGIEASFKTLGDYLAKQAKEGIIHLDDLKEMINHSTLFDDKGYLIDNRQNIFAFLEKFLHGLAVTRKEMNAFLETANIAFQIKSQVLGHERHFVTSSADFEEIKNKIGPHQFLTVVRAFKGKYTPIGLIKSSELSAFPLGTVTMRDFCNYEEMNIPSYFQVISVLDHHKITINTKSPIAGVFSDAQACNTLVAEIAMDMNDRFSTLNIAEEEFEKKKLEKVEDWKLSEILNRKANHFKKNGYFIHPQREFMEYLHFIYGILDDTDLLMKVTRKDVEVIANLLNRMKTIMANSYREVVQQENIHQEDYTKTMAKKILQTKDMYSLYKKVYHFKEKAVEESIQKCLSDSKETLFSDTKIINGCCRVGQMKMFASNVKIFKEFSPKLREKWYIIADRISQERPEIDLHLYMVSTIRGADEVFHSEFVEYQHYDQLWFYIPKKELAFEHLKRFLSNFQKSPVMKNMDVKIAFLGKNKASLQETVDESGFVYEELKDAEGEGLPLGVIYYGAGKVNSRKTLISPYLPSIME
ncbi:MAG TPA: hypothetical protein P5048_04870, partial [Chlamydiales bacterium]|nr:hypothetical protein [Chlamydiales bacterium]